MLTSQRVILISFNCIFIGTLIISCSYYKTQINTNKQKLQCLKPAWAVCFQFNFGVQSCREMETRWYSLLLRLYDSWLQSHHSSSGLLSLVCSLCKTRVLWATGYSVGSLSQEIFVNNNDSWRIWRNTGRCGPQLFLAVYSATRKGARDRQARSQLLLHGKKACLPDLPSHSPAAVWITLGNWDDMIISKPV